jgi:hypothetical protein
MDGVSRRRGHPGDVSRGWDIDSGFDSERPGSPAVRSRPEMLLPALALVVAPRIRTSHRFRCRSPPSRWRSTQKGALVGIGAVSVIRVRTGLEPLVAARRVYSFLAVALP